MFEKTILPNGIRVVTEFHRDSRAVSTGVWLETGTRDEKVEESGLSHFLEHMVFKGTKRRSAYELARELEAVGGDLNAHTTQEYTCFHATTLKENFGLQLDVLCDLVLDAKFEPKETQKEKTVVLQEIAMTGDTPEEYVYDLFFDEVFGASPLGRPILGLEKSVKNFRRKDLIAYYNTRYTNKNLVVSVAGRVEHEEVVKLVEKYLGAMRRRFKLRARRKPRFQPIRQVIKKQTEQVQVVVGMPAASFKDPLRFEAFILNGFLGGGMTSRLYQSVREKRGLAYTIYSALTTFTDTGLITIYAGTDASQATKVLELIQIELHKLGKKKISDAELKLFKRQIRGGLLLGSDDIENRMNSLGINEMVFNEYRSVDNIVAEIERVSAKSLKQYVEEYLDENKFAVMVMGDVDENKVLKAVNNF